MSQTARRYTARLYAHDGKPWGQSHQFVLFFTQHSCQTTLHSIVVRFEHGKDCQQAYVSDVLLLPEKLRVVVVHLLIKRLSAIHKVAWVDANLLKALRDHVRHLGTEMDVRHQGHMLIPAANSHAVQASTSNNEGVAALWAHHATMSE